MSLIVHGRALPEVDTVYSRSASRSAGGHGRLVIVALVLLLVVLSQCEQQQI